jgi:hypothetical protein
MITRFDFYKTNPCTIRRKALAWVDGADDPARAALIQDAVVKKAITAISQPAAWR